jgi:preprotein translocase subunit SecB
MSDKNKKNDSAAISAPEIPVNILAQYVRDLSFENPNAPGALRGAAPPEMEINIGMDARKLPGDDEDLYEVVLNLSATATRDKAAMFLVELQYAAMVTLKGVPQKTHHPVLFIEIPRLLFPFARQIISDMTIQGGYPPLMLNPVDFQALYMERFKDDIEAARKAAKN